MQTVSDCRAGHEGEVKDMEAKMPAGDSLSAGNRVPSKPARNSFAKAFLGRPRVPEGKGPRHPASSPPSTGPAALTDAASNIGSGSQTHPTGEVELGPKRVARRWGACGLRPSTRQTERHPDLQAGEGSMRGSDGQTYGPQGQNCATGSQISTNEAPYQSPMAANAAGLVATVSVAAATSQPLQEDAGPSSTSAANPELSAMQIAMAVTPAGLSDSEAEDASQEPSAAVEESDIRNNKADACLASHNLDIMPLHAQDMASPSEVEDPADSPVHELAPPEGHTGVLPSEVLGAASHTVAQREFLSSLRPPPSAVQDANRGESQAACAALHDGAAHVPDSDEGPVGDGANLDPLGVVCLRDLQSSGPSTSSHCSSQQVSVVEAPNASELVKLGDGSVAPSTLASSPLLAQPLLSQPTPQRKGPRRPSLARDPDGTSADHMPGLQASTADKGRYGVDRPRSWAREGPQADSSERTAGNAQSEAGQTSSTSPTATDARNKWLQVCPATSWCIWCTLGIATLPSFAFWHYCAKQIRSHVLGVLRVIGNASSLDGWAKLSGMTCMGT